MERTHDSDPTPTIVSPIPTSKKWEPLVPAGVGALVLAEVGVVRNHGRPVQTRSESSRVIQSRPESSGVVRSCPESSGVVRSRPESSEVVQSLSESTGIGQSQLKPSLLVIRLSLCFFNLSLCMFTSYTGLCFESRLRPIATPNDYW